jgi:hypothetical protein
MSEESYDGIGRYKGEEKIIEYSIMDAELMDSLHRKISKTTPNPDLVVAYIVISNNRIKYKYRNRRNKNEEKR